MHRVIDISLAGHPEPYRLHDDAYEALAAYLEQARTGLAEDPDGDEVVGDLERSIGEKLAMRLVQDRRVIDLADVRSVLDAVGGIDTTPTVSAPPPRGARRIRRLYRIHDGKEVAGVCQGLAVYAELDVSLVRWIVALLIIFTGGILGLVYIAAMFILPVVNTREEYFAAMQALELADGIR